MVEIVHIGRPPFPSELLDRLKGQEALFHPDPKSESWRWLTLAGLHLAEVKGSIPSGATLILPHSLGPVERLVEIADRLLLPGGCPWDQEQTHESLKKCLLEETYELFEAIDEKNPKAIVEELGDVLLQPIMHAEMARLAGSFTIDEVAEAISEKLILRHPHVFGDVSVAGTEDVLKNWDEIKRKEKAERKSALDGIPNALPALTFAQSISRRAAKSGFEWPDIDGVFAKLDEEMVELKEAIANGNDADKEAELGDVLFTVVNIARWLNVDAEEALRQMVKRFTLRFQRMEANSQMPLSELSPDEWEQLWSKSKAEVG